METPAWWWQTDSYDGEDPLPQELIELAGPHGVALVDVFPDGRTQAGWGSEKFMGEYEGKKFSARRKVKAFEMRQWPFAIVMRSLPVVCIDIDGKNGGFVSAPAFLGNAPVTLAETSKSGNGYHLFYSLPDTWDPVSGFGMIGDFIGIADGVDIRGTGCVYHHTTQRWNDRAIAPCPAWILDTLIKREQYKAARKATIVNTSTLDEWEQLIMHDELFERLNKPIPEGKRNNTLFAIGSEMKTAGVPDWDTRIGARAEELGLDADEVTKLVSNIETYA